MSIFVQFLIGLIFGVGLVVSGMSDPAKVLNFLDLAAIPAGTWDASLGFVMLAAVVVTFVGYRLVLRRDRPMFSAAFNLPTKTAIDAKIIVGPALFGLGWGLVGFCPGPVFTALGLGNPAVWVFFLPMLVGMAAARWLDNRPIPAKPVAALP